MAGFCRTGLMVLTIPTILLGCTTWKAGPSTLPGTDNTPGPAAPGLLALEIDGEDIEGQPFKLSDYRGKVILLDFWGNW